MLIYYSVRLLKSLNACGSVSDVIFLVLCEVFNVLLNSWGKFGKLGIPEFLHVSVWIEKSVLHVMANEEIVNHWFISANELAIIGKFSGQMSVYLSKSILNFWDGLFPFIILFVLEGYNFWEPKIDNNSLIKHLSFV